MSFKSLGHNGTKRGSDKTFDYCPRALVRKREKRSESEPGGLISMIQVSIMEERSRGEDNLRLLGLDSEEERCRREGERSRREKDWQEDMEKLEEDSRRHQQLMEMIVFAIMGKAGLQLDHKKASHQIVFHAVSL